MLIIPYASSVSDLKMLQSQKALKQQKHRNSKRPRIKKQKQSIDIFACPDDLLPAYTANGTTSPLLCLPAEIRLRIFELVIGDSRCIEIGYACPGHKVPASIPLHRPGELILPGPKVSGFYLVRKDDYDVFPRPFGMASMWTRTPKVESKFHPLNRICRQIYCESSLLPYSMHTFALGDLTSLQAWIGSLTSSQKLAVRSVYYADFDSQAQHYVVDTILSLPGLNKLFLPDILRRINTVEISAWSKVLEAEDVALRFLKQPDHICRHVKVVL